MQNNSLRKIEIIQGIRNLSDKLKTVKINKKSHDTFINRYHDDKNPERRETAKIYMRFSNDESDEIKDIEGRIARLEIELEKEIENIKRKEREREAEIQHRKREINDRSVLFNNSIAIYPEEGNEDYMTDLEREKYALGRVRGGSIFNALSQANSAYGAYNDIKGDLYNVQHADSINKKFGAVTSLIQHSAQLANNASNIIGSGKKGIIQAVLFSRSSKKYKTSQPRLRFIRNDLKLEPLKRVHVTQNYFRYRIEEPDKNKKTRIKTINNDIKLIIEYDMPKRGNGLCMSAEEKKIINKKIDDNENNIKEIKKIMTKLRNQAIFMEHNSPNNPLIAEKKKALAEMGQYVDKLDMEVKELAETC